ncbi:MAG: hypothetical protein HYS62_01775 [Candidatus Aenigmarchaeota archaeon]|nr:hypothetical protein [Candidatus Aenigmarchaeota archaeon]
MLVEMEIEIIEDKENPFFKRKDLKVRIRHLGSSTPSKADIGKELASKYGVDISQVQIDYVFSQRGLGESFVSCKILQEKPKETVKAEETKGENSETQASATA